MIYKKGATVPGNLLLESRISGFWIFSLNS
jgi:hypothetical protein